MSREVREVRSFLCGKREAKSASTARKSHGYTRGEIPDGDAVQEQVEVKMKERKRVVLTGTIDDILLELWRLAEMCWAENQRLYDVL